MNTSGQGDVKKWVREISRAQNLYDLKYEDEAIEITDSKDGQLVKYFVLDEVYAEEREVLINAVVPHLPASRNWRYELKQRLNGLERLSLWTHRDNSSVLREAAQAMLDYPILTLVMLRCSKTGHNVSLANVDKKMKERQDKGFYD